MIELNGLCKRFSTSSGVVTALQDIDLRVESGERLGVFGPSGCGKTTLLRCLAGLDSPDSGAIRIGGIEVFHRESGVDVPPWGRPVGLVFQDFALWPHMRVLENVLFPLMHGRSNALTRAEAREVALEALHRVRLADLTERFPFELSGGQRQRVALARAIAPRPALLLMDEPLSNLDPHLRESTRNELIAILEDAEITTIFVSHEHRDCLLIADTLGIMRNGRLVQKGPPADIAANPLDASVAQTLACGFLIPCRRAVRQGGALKYELADTGEYVAMPDAGDVSERQDVVLLFPKNGFRLHAQHAPAGSSSTLRAEVIRAGYVINLGWCILARIGNAHVEVWASERPLVRRGDEVQIAFDPGSVRVLPAPANHA